MNILVKQKLARTGQSVTVVKRGIDLSFSCCGGLMELRLRPVIYAGKVEIDHVPVYHCVRCQHSQVLPEIKQELTHVIDHLGDKPNEQYLNFPDLNEVAYLLYQASSTKEAEGSIDELIHKRIDQLLDLLSFSMKINDHKWGEDLRKRLRQITNASVQNQIKNELDCEKS